MLHTPLLSKVIPSTWVNKSLQQCLSWNHASFGYLICLPNPTICYLYCEKNVLFVVMEECWQAVYVSITRLGLLKALNLSPNQCRPQLLLWLMTARSIDQTLLKLRMNRQSQCHIQGLLVSLRAVLIAHDLRGHFGKKKSWSQSSDWY